MATKRIHVKHIKDISSPKARTGKKGCTAKSGSEILVHTTLGKVKRAMPCRSKVGSVLCSKSSFTGTDFLIKKQDEYKKLYEQEIKDVNRAARTLEKYRID